LAKLLLDAFQAASNIRTFTVGRSAQDYLTDTFLRSAVERQLEIVGEALNHVRAEGNDLSRRIANLNQWVGLRHRIAHGYDHLDHEIVWETVVDDIPHLLHDLALLLNEVPPVEPHEGTGH
jgi:uncharacterized protein with HEPN domain